MSTVTSHAKRFFSLARKSIAAWSDDYAPSMGAAIAYYAVFSLAPLLLIVIAVAGFVFGREAVQGEIVGQLSGLLGRDGALAVQGLIKSASQPAQGLVATVISLVVLAVGATTVFGELQSSLDRIWGIPTTANSGIRATLRARLLSFGLILGLAFLLMVSLTVSAAVAAMGTWIGSVLPGWAVTLQIINLAVSLCITTLLFAMIYKLMPQARIAWRDVWVGAVVTAVLFEVGKLLIGLYVARSSVSSSFAAAGSIIVLLVWVYYSAQIFLLGAEFTWVYASEHGSRATLPVPDAPEVPSKSDPVPAAGAYPYRPDAQTAAVVASSTAPDHADHLVEAYAPQGPTMRQKIYVTVALTALQIVIRMAMRRGAARKAARRAGLRRR
ncbi:YihY/virulence factor BrkB family protein [Xylophilus ampelinus]|uniref:Membrane protein n=1 Tax=Xylophilus ampelinus TaxID=54067 RepID=A0A318SQ07_9BURK|nr:YihY/virulence factor BrkB family protein [Xylophilus ampelinus]MCS4508956.1 YihY/virulence factor BrkB family protein [Xylophilus ampelinus]PYE79522.1 membrane protein [Xylophilus ampelinus]